MVTIKHHPESGQMEITVTKLIDEQLMQRLSVDVLSEKIATEIVEEIIAKKFGEILSKVDTQAIANLAIARCATKIAEALEK